VRLTGRFNIRKLLTTKAHAEYDKLHAAPAPAVGTKAGNAAVAQTEKEIAEDPVREAEDYEYGEQMLLDHLAAKEDNPASEEKAGLPTRSVVVCAECLSVLSQTTQWESVRHLHLEPILPLPVRTSESTAPSGQEKRRLSAIRAIQAMRPENIAMNTRQPLRSTLSLRKWPVLKARSAKWMPLRVQSHEKYSDTFKPKTTSKILSSGGEPIVTNSRFLRD